MRARKPSPDPGVKRFKELLGADLTDLRRLAKWLRIPNYMRLNWLELAGAIADETEALNTKKPPAETGG
jgi:hypothetical protein